MWVKARFAKLEDSLGSTALFIHQDISVEKKTQDELEETLHR